MNDTLVRPRPDRAFRSRLPPLVFAFAFIAIQVGLAFSRLDPPKRIAAGAVILLSGLIVAAWYAVFLWRASVILSDDDVIVRDWLGRVRLRADRRRVKFALVSVNDLGLSEQFAILSVDTGAPTILMRRMAWGDRALTELSTALHGRRVAELRFHRMSKGALRREFPQIHVQNLPAIAVIVAMILLMAFIINWR